MTDEQIDIFDLMGESGEQYKPIVADDYRWSFSDYPKEKNGLKVFSCFACGGGSTMGYKLAGCDVIGCLEIDERMIKLYEKNHHPKYSYCMDIRDFNQIPDDELPPELFDLDILDGSPPCTTFSMAGLRSDTWGVEKKFREGQKKQTLDDLGFVFIETVKKLKPKVMVMENVEGLLLGDAFEYVQKIYEMLGDAGYIANHWLVRCEDMGIPQKRRRVIFVACRNDIGVDPHDISMAFNYAPVPFRMVKTDKGDDLQEGAKMKTYIEAARKGDKDLSSAAKRAGFNGACFSNKIVYDDEICPTITAHTMFFRFSDKKKMSAADIQAVQTFPVDYDFMDQSVAYVCGMSVPPVMMKRVVTRLIDSGVFK